MPAAWCARWWPSPPRGCASSSSRSGAPAWWAACCSAAADIAEAEREKQRQEIEDQLLANRTLADALIRTRSPPGALGSGPGELAQAQPGAGEAIRPHVAAGASARGDRRPVWAQRAGSGAARTGRCRRYLCTSWRRCKVTMCPTIWWGAPGQRSDAPPAERGGDAGAAELELEFYRRYLERRLLSYQSRGTLPRQRLMLRSPSRAGQEVQPRGPFIVCVDTSGSMGAIRRRCQGAVSRPAQRGDGGEAGLLSDALLHRGGDPGDHRRHRAWRSGRFLSMSFHGGPIWCPAWSRPLTQL